MILFCFLWTPLFCLFWRSITVSEAENSGGIWALLLGSAAAFVRFLAGSFISPGAFGFSRWLSVCVDIVALPAALPLAARFLLVRLGALGRAADSANFALLWLIPGAVMAAANRSGLNDPALLALALVLRTAIAAGLPCFMNMTGKSRGKIMMLLRALAVTVLPLLAATSYWAFFSQRTWIGILLFVPALLPAVVSAAVNFTRPAKSGLA
ncbi:MAG: hypothetical protein LBK63_12950 [Treponema sp.]|nr:hypothetical protein [Treponema sp.]